MHGHVTDTTKNFTLAAVGGMAGDIAGLPAGWLLGAVASTLTGSLIGLRLHYPSILQASVLLLVGINIESSLSPQFFSEAGFWLPSLLGLMVAMLAITPIVPYALSKLTKLSANMSFLSVYPGHVVLILPTASQYLCSVVQITVTQGSRLLFLAVIFPFLTQGNKVNNASATQENHYIALILMVLAAILGAVICKSRIPGD